MLNKELALAHSLKRKLEKAIRDKYRNVLHRLAKGWDEPSALYYISQTDTDKAHSWKKKLANLAASLKSDPPGVACENYETAISVWNVTEGLSNPKLKIKV